MSSTGIQISHCDYTVGWVCALPLEMAAAKTMLDEVHSTLPTPSSDHNSYTLGRIRNHNIVIVCLPSGVYGGISAAVATSQMRTSFPSLQFSLMVGIGGGVPSQAGDIRLGDIVISKPTRDFGGVIQYDYGKAVKEGSLQRTGTLNKPPQSLLAALSNMEADHLLNESKIPKYLAQISAIPLFSYPGEQEDLLFQAGYEHPIAGVACKFCAQEKLLLRPARSSADPKVHYGLIASSNQVVKSGRVRDRLAGELGVLCFEMEAAGLMDQVPCLVIRGISDYADSHKNDRWQGYAAATAAACAKEMLAALPVIQIVREHSVDSKTQSEARSMESEGLSYPKTYSSDGGPMFLGNQSAGRDINVRTDQYR